MMEKRAVPRHKVFKHGTLAFYGRTVDCTVRNISPSGARVDIASSINLPHAFTLVIESDNLLRRCHAVWSRERQIGVAFD